MPPLMSFPTRFQSSHSIIFTSSLDSQTDSFTKEIVQLHASICEVPFGEITNPSSMEVNFDEF